MTLQEAGLLLLALMALLVVLVPGDWLERRLKR